MDWGSDILARWASFQDTFEQAQGQEKDKCPLHPLSGCVWGLCPVWSSCSQHNHSLCDMLKEKGFKSLRADLAIWAFTCTLETAVLVVSLYLRFVISRITSSSLSSLLLYLCSSPNDGIGPLGPLVGWDPNLVLCSPPPNLHMTKDRRLEYNISRPQVLGFL